MMQPAVSVECAMQKDCPSAGKGVAELEVDEVVEVDLDEAAEVRDIMEVAETMEVDVITEVLEIGK